MAAKKPSDLHYHTPTLTKFFALASIALVVTTLWMVLDDHNRQWKKIQQEFIDFDTAKTKAEIEAAQAEISPQEQERLWVGLDEARSRLGEQLEGMNAGRADFRSAADALYRVDQSWRHAKAYHATARYEYEKAHVEGAHNEPELKAAYDELSAEVAHWDNEVQVTTKARDAAQDSLDSFTADVDAVEQEIAVLETMVSRLRTKLDSIEPWWATKYVLNEPVLDIMAPSLKIRQVVVDKIHQDINYLTIPRVDRCQTCHMAIDQPGYEEVDANPAFRSHPQLDLYVTDISPHPMEKFGCTTCHFGRDRSVDFARVTHTPETPEQEEQWVDDYGWHEPVLWDFPMLPGSLIDSTCFKCHMDQDRVPGSAKAAEAEDFYEQFGCFGCHNANGYDDLRKVGPSLNNLAAKVPNKDWAYRWIEAPRAFRAKTRMPHFWGVSNNSEPDDVPSNHAEIRGTVEYLYAMSGDIEYESIPVRGNASRGEKMVRDTGCMGCHVVGNSPEDDALSRQHRRRFGPTLAGIATKTRPEWIYHWLKSPRDYWHETRMPDLRLTDQEAADITAYLMTLTSDSFMRSPIPEPQVEARDEMLMEFFQGRMTRDQARAELEGMTEQDRWVMTGERTIRSYGCFGCHDIPGFEDAQPVSIELSTEGSKSVHLFDYGHLHDIPHTRQAWIAQKLRDPRGFDEGKVKTRSAYQKMPDFGFTEEEIQIGTTTVLSFVKDQLPDERRKTLNGREEALEAGRRLVRERNCRGCHELEGEGRAIFDVLVRNLLADGINELDATAQAEGYAPPLITVEGAKVEPDWLFSFLKEPTTIRSWMDLRMPTFHFTDEETNIVISYFNALSEQTYPFKTYDDLRLTSSERRAADQLVGRDYFNCFACHQRGDETISGPASQWAPNLSLANGRLKPDWIEDWMRDPNAIQPGTRMPTYFDPSSFDESGPPDILDGDENAQIRVVMKWVLDLGGPPPDRVGGAGARR